MKCMCAQTRPRFILSSEGVFGGMEFEPMLTPREKSPLPENVPRGGSNQRRCGQRAQALPTELFRPPQSCLTLSRTKQMYLSYFPCINKFGLPFSASCPVNRNVKGEECLPLVSVSKGCTSLFFFFFSFFF